MSETTFRTVEAPQPEPTPEKPAEVTGIVNDPDGVPKEPKASALDDWETLHGKYGHEYFGIKNIAGTFPMNTYFSQVDKYIRAEIAERGIDATPEAWQNVLKEVESELGVEKDAYKRLQKLSNYLKILAKMKQLKKQKESYLK